MSYFSFLRNSTALLSFTAVAALAQNSMAQDAADVDDTDIIVVTGSYIGGKTQQNSHYPHNVVSEVEISAQG